jgi:ATP-dependent DNA helicase PIF1
MENSDNKEEQKSWGEWLLQVGNGHIANPVDLDVHHIKHCDTIDGLIANVFDDVNNLGKTAIVTSLRTDVEQINDIMLQKDTGEIKQYLSIDEPMEEEESQHESTLLPTEFLNTLTPQGMPKHSLKLKIGCPIILLRNLNKAAGLANGTRLIITKLNEYKISGTIVTQGTFCGNEVMIPRIDLIAESKSTPFLFKRR